jgi:hypothetical protein
MVLPAAYAPISLGQIQGEFGGDAPTAITEYYRGGAYTTDNNTNVPTGGTIALSNFYSAYYGILVAYQYFREPGTQLTTTLYLSAPGLPTIAITTGGVGVFSNSSYFAPNVAYTITASSQAGPGSIIQGYDFIRDEFDNIIGTNLLNEIWVEDATDGDYADLRWYPSQGEIFDTGGGNFTYILYY